MTTHGWLVWVLVALCAAGCATTTINRSYALLEQGKAADAQRLLAACPYQDNAYVQLNLGAAYDRLGRPDQAKPLYESVLRLPDATPAKHTPFIAKAITLHGIAAYNLSRLR